ncbi:MAG TPA: hypothetical protein PKK61_08950 [Defluviitaleaceae bacterium]|nr:hypothetical protein [Defluviitaleaceae bacterium]
MIKVSYVCFNDILLNYYRIEVYFSTGRDKNVAYYKVKRQVGVKRELFFFTISHHWPCLRRGGDTIGKLGH